MLQYATRVRTIKNDVSRNEVSKDVVKLRQQVEYWKQQAGLSPEQRAAVELHVRFAVLMFVLWRYATVLCWKPAHLRLPD